MTSLLQSASVDAGHTMNERKSSPNSFQGRHETTKERTPQRRTNISQPHRYEFIYGVQSGYLIFFVEGFHLKREKRIKKNSTASLLRKKLFLRTSFCEGIPFRLCLPNRKLPCPETTAISCKTHLPDKNNTTRLPSHVDARRLGD